MPQKNHLTSTKSYRTLVHAMDATTKKLLMKLREAERVRWEKDQEIEHIRKTLELLGIKPGTDFTSWLFKDSEYAQKRPFARTTLTEACLTILQDHKGHWFTKSQVEYLAVRGGYEFSTENTKNSVDVTLRRLAADGKCAAERVRGARGNRYCSFPDGKKPAQ